MADLLTEEEELTQAPPTWKAIEASDKYKNSSNVERRTAFGKWDEYSRKYAQKEGLWDDPEFKAEYVKRADQTSSQFDTLWDTFGDNVKLYHSVRNFLDPAIEFGARLVRGAETATKGGISATYDVASKATEQHRNPYLNKTPEDAKIDIPSLTKQIEDLEGQVVKDFGGAKISDPYSSQAQNLAGLTSKLAKTRNQLAQAQGAAAGVVKEGFAGNLSRATEDLSADWQDKKTEAGEKYKGLIDASKDSRFAMKLAESVGQSIPGTAASILNPALGLGVMYMQQYDSSKTEYAAKMEEQGKPVDPVQQSQYARAQSFGQVPFEIVGDIALAGAIKKIFKAIPDGVVEGGVKSFGGWMGSQIKRLVAPTAGEVLLTTPAQSIVQDVLAEKYGVQAPTTIGEKLAKIPEQQKMALAQSVLMGGAPVGVAAIARSALTADQKSKIVETKQKTEALAQNNAPLTAQALAESTAGVLVSEDPSLVSELIDQEAPEGTFTEEPTGDERFAPPETRAPEEAIEALSPNLEPLKVGEGVATDHGDASILDPTPNERGEVRVIHSESGNEMLVPLNGIHQRGQIKPEIAPVTETLPNETTPIESEGPSGPVLPEEQQQPAAQNLPQDVGATVGEAGAVTPGAVVTFGGRPAVVAELRGDGTALLRQTSEQGGEVFSLARVDQITPNGQPIQERVHEPRGAISAAGTIPTAEPAGIAGPARAGSEAAVNSLQPTDATGSITEFARQSPEAISDTARQGVPVSGPERTKPPSQSPASFTPEQNAVHDAFIAQEPPPLEKPEEAQHFSSWVQETAPKRPVVLLSEGGQTAVITPSSKPDRKFQLTFMEQGIDGIPEAFHDIAAQSVDEAVGEAYKRGFTGTQNYKDYDRAGKTSTTGEGDSSQNPKSMAGQRARVVPGTPEGIRAEIPATGTGTAGGRPVTIRVWDKKNRAVVSMDANADSSLLRDLRVQDGVYKALIRCL